MLSQTAEYALRAMVTLAQPDARPRTAQEVAAGAKVPLDYLSKVLNALARAGLVSAQRGRGGGFQPARSPEEITIFEIINAVDPLQRIRTCPLGLSAHGENLCPLHRKLDDAAKATEEAFRSTSLASISGFAAAPVAQMAGKTSDKISGKISGKTPGKISGKKAAKILIKPADFASGLCHEKGCHAAS